MLGTICVRIFREFANFFIDFAQIFKNLPDFQGFCPDFRLIKTFADVLAPLQCLHPLLHHWSNPSTSPWTSQLDGSGWWNCSRPAQRYSAAK